MIERLVAVDDAVLAVSETRGTTLTVLALHGASEGTRDFVLYKHLHAALAPQSVGVVTFDRRGEGASSGAPSRGRLDAQAADALALIESIESESIIVWGFSQGAWVAPVVAIASSRVRGFVGIAATGVTPYEQMLYGVATHMRLAGVDEAAISRVADLRRRYAECMRGFCEDESTLARDLSAASTEPWWDLAYLPATLPTDSLRRRWIEEMDYDPSPAMRALAVPALLLYGSDDAWSPVVKSVDAWRRDRPRGLTIEVLDGVGHDLLRDDRSVDPRYERSLVRFIKSLGLS